MIMHSILSVLLLLSCFTVLGLGITPTQTVRRYLPFVPIFGYVALIGFSYILSANLRLTGQAAMGYSILILLLCSVIRLPSLTSTFREIRSNRELGLSALIVIIPMISILFPALLFGFKYFYGFVNYDFFFNSQDAYFLQTHTVIQFNKTNISIVPLNWSADYSGRIAIGILGSFFPKWVHMTTLEFNSLLLNTIVILFSLAISVFCKEFFNLSKKAIILTVLLCLMSAAYVQAYSYYVLGQISVIPVFIVFCIYLKKFLEVSENKQDTKLFYSYIFTIGLLLNVMFIMYAIISFLAGCLLIASYALYSLKNHKQIGITPLFKTVVFAAIIFSLIRILIVPESIEVIKSWIFLSSRVASANNHIDDFIVFSDYLTTDFLGILFGLVNYPASHSLLDVISPSDFFRSYLVLIAGIIGLIATLCMLHAYVKSNKNPWAARSIFLSLFTIFLSISFYFFYEYAAYGIYKFQTWLMPIFLPLYVYYFINIQTSKFTVILKITSIFILFLNVSCGLIYLSDFFVNPTKQQFVNLRGLTNNKDMDNVISHLKESKTNQASLFLTNGIELAWFADLLRTISISKVAHNTQPLIEKDFFEPACTRLDNQKNYPAGLMIISNPNSNLNDITGAPQGGKVLYENSRYRLIDPSTLQTLIYFGTGTYPVEYNPSKTNGLPSKFRWVEKGAEIMVYSNKDKLVNLIIEAAPGYVNNNNQPRSISIKSLGKESNFKINKLTRITLKNFQLHQGLNCLTIQSPDKVTRLPQYGALFRSNIPLDPRLNNFAIGYVGLEKVG